MIKRLALVFAVVYGLSAQSAAPAPQAPPAAPVSLDTAALNAYFRHMLMWPNDVQIAISIEGPSPIPGYYRVKIRGSRGDKFQDEAFTISSDSKVVIKGDILETAKNPFQPVIDQLNLSNQPFLGSPDAPVKVVEFADFQCPYCKQEAGVVRNQLMQAFPNSVQLFYMDYPLYTIHPYARDAAIMGRCIYAQNNDAFWAYHDWIFEHQSEITLDSLREKALGFAKADKRLDAERLTACVSTPEPKAQVDKSQALGDALGINATPTLFINGRRMVGTIPIDDLKMVVDHEIAYAKAKKADDCCSVQISLPGTKAPAK